MHFSELLNFHIEPLYLSILSQYLSLKLEQLFFQAFQNFSFLLIALFEDMIILDVLVSFFQVSQNILEIV
jgi:hypothetical protein